MPETRRGALQENHYSTSQLCIHCIYDTGDPSARLFEWGRLNVEKDIWILSLLPPHALVGAASFVSVQRPASYFKTTFYFASVQNLKSIGPEGQTSNQLLLLIVGEPGQDVSAFSWSWSSRKK